MVPFPRAFILEISYTGTNRLSLFDPGRRCDFLDYYLCFAFLHLTQLRDDFSDLEGLTPFTIGKISPIGC